MGWSNYLFSFRGRLNRQPYWMFVFVAFGFMLVMAIIAAPYVIIEHPSTSDGDRPLSPLGWATVAVECVIVIAYLIAAVAISLKRLHDRNKGFGWFLLFLVVPGVLSNVADPQVGIAQSLPMAATLVIALVSIVLSLWGFVEMGFLRGTQGDNRYGPDPLTGQI